MPSALVIDGHPDAESLTSSLAQRYATGYGDARLLALRDLEFDPHMRFGYRQRMPLEPDLADAKRAMQEAKTIIIMTPLWWGSVPALLKGFFDRALYSGFAYRYHDDDPMWDGLLTGRSAQVITTSDAPRIWTFMAYRNSDLGTVKYATLRFCGVKPVKVMRLDRMKDATLAERQRYLDRVRRSVP